MTKKYKPKRKARKGEFVCTCSAYSFPHRMTGGRCSGYDFVADYWNSHWGSGDCSDCVLVNKDEGICCEVEEGRERVTECRAFQEFVHIHEIIIYKKRGRNGSHNR